MRNFSSHIISKISLVILTIALLVPSFVKLAHAFENHKHEICVNPQQTHFHEFDLDCEFYKFKLNSKLFHIAKHLDITSIDEQYKPIISQYYYISEYQRLSFSLRGPPSLV